MALSPYTVTVITKQDAPFNVIPNAPIEIKIRLSNGASGGLALIYEDEQGLIPITQTGATADANGQFIFFAESAEYNAIYQSQIVPVNTGMTASAVINNLTIPFVFNDINALVASSTVFTSGKLLDTKVNNTDTNMGGAKYRVVTAAEYAAETPLTPTPDGQLVGGRIIGMDHYLNGGTALIAKYNMTVGFDRACGAIGDDRILGATHDDYPALQKLMEWSRQNSPIDEGKIQKGYQKTFLHPRSKFYMTAPLGLRSARTDYDFNQCRFVASGSHSLLYWEGALCNLHNGFFDGLTYGTRAGYLASGDSLIVWGKDEPIALSNGSQVSLNNIWCWGGYHCFELSSISTVDASFIWGSSFNECYFHDAVEHCYYVNSPQEVSTTMRYNGCHTSATTRDSCTVGAFDYFCKLHHLSDETVTKPEVGNNWETYWHKEPTFTDRGAWVDGNQYMTNAKGFYWFNVSTVTMAGCSMDGGNNSEQGSVIDYTGQFIDIGVFHLEKFNHTEANTLRPIYCVGDVKIESLDLFNNRFKMPNATDPCIFFGGNPSPAGNNTRITFDSFVNKAPDGTSGVATSIDCAGFKSVALGSGVPLNTVINTTGTTTAQRGIHNRTVKVLTSATSTISTTPDARDNGVLFTSGDGLADNTLNITLDNLLYVESTDWNGVEQKDTYQFEFKLTPLSKASTINFLAGADSPTFVGATTYTGGPTVRATKISPTKWLLEEVANSISTNNEWVEFIPTGSYTSGAFTLPNSKAVDDIAAIKMVWSNAAILSSTSVESREIGNTFISKKVGAEVTSSYSISLNFGLTGTTDATLLRAGYTLVSSFVKFT